MIVFAQDKCSFVDSNRVDVFNVEFCKTGEDYSGAIGYYVLSADNYELGDFSKEKQAVKALNEIANAMVAGQTTYQVMHFDD